MAGDFTQLRCWQEAVVLLRMVKDVTAQFKGPGSKRATEQLMEAAESISSNIAEGYGKGYSPDCIRFQNMAVGSAGEVESRLIASAAAGRISSDAVSLSIRQARRTRSMTLGFIRYVESQLLKAS